MKTIRTVLNDHTNEYIDNLLLHRIRQHYLLFPASVHEEDSIRTLYVDIETTGFNRTADTVYLLGQLEVIDGHTVIIDQYLCEKAGDEYMLLFNFNKEIDGSTRLVHFNGNSFDLPFLKARMALYGIHENISLAQSIDYYPLLRPFKKILGTDNFKLKTLERLASYERSDTYTGGELIQIYSQYLSGDHFLETLFLDHNLEDMIGLFYLNGFVPLYKLQVPNNFGTSDTAMDICADLKTNSHNKFPLDPLRWNYLSAVDVPSVLFAEKDIYDAKKQNETSEHVYITYQASLETSSHDFKAEHTFNGYTLVLSDTNVIFRMPIYNGTLFYYYENYKDYYYLAEEDYAIHKVVADFVNSKHKKKATKETAYIKKEGIFVKCPLSKQDVTTSLTMKHSDVHVFSDHYTSKHCYIEMNDFISIGEGLINPSIRALFIS